MFRTVQNSLKIMTARLDARGGRPYKNLPEKCSYLVSVGKENFTGNALMATLGLINAEFKECDVIVTGTLQRFNLAIENELSLEDAYALSKTRELEWISDTKQILNKIPLACQFNFIHWDRYRENVDFQLYYNKVGKLLEEDVYIQAMNNTVTQFCDRYETKMPAEKFALKTQQIKENSFLFLKEECAAMFLWNGLIIYPAKASAILEKMIQHINCFRESDSQLQWQHTRFINSNIENWRKVVLSDKSSFYDTAIFQVPDHILAHYLKNEITVSIDDENSDEKNIPCKSQ